MLRVLGKRESINVRKVLWTCDEIGVAYVQEEWGAGTRPTSDAEFMALNPKGLVPVIVDDGNVLTESNTIVRYLAARYRRFDLLPEDPFARARVEEMMDWQATEFNFAWRPAFPAIVRKNPDAGTEAQIRQSIKEWGRMVSMVEERLIQAGPYMCGDTFTVADIVIGLSVNRWFQSPIERIELPRVRAYLDRLMERPASRRHLGGDTD
jgi:glutathione S-transferase